MTAAAAVLGLLGAACGGEPASPVTGEASSTRESSDTSDTSGTDVQPVTATQNTEPERPIGPPLVSESSAAEILAAVEDVHGPTSDASGQMNRFVTFPPLATPPGAELSEMRVDARSTVDAGSITITSQLTLDVAATAQDLLEFYRHEMDDLAWTPIRERSTSGPAGTRLLAFEKPGSPYPLTDLTIAIIPTEPGRSQVRLDHVEQAETSGSTARDRLAGWAEGLPLPEGGEVTGAAIQTSDEVRHSLFYSLTVSYDDLAPAEATAELRRALPTRQFTEAPQTPSGESLDNWVYLTSPFFTETRVSPHISHRGTTQLAVNARVPFTPR